MADTVALAKVDDQQSLDAFRAKYNVLAPTADVRVVSPFYRVRGELVKLSPNPLDNDVWSPKNFGNGGLAPAKNGITKLADAAGREWDVVRCGFEQTNDPDLIRYTAVGGIVQGNGRWRWKKCTRTQKISALPRGYDVNHAYATVETKAKLRVDRELLNLKQAYSAQELEKAFLVIRHDFSPDMEDPEIRQAFLLAAMQAQGDLYGGAKKPLPPGVIDAQARITSMQGGDHADSQPTAAPGDRIEDLGEDQDDIPDDAPAAHQGDHDTNFTAAYQEINAVSTLSDLAQLTQRLNKQKAMYGPHWDDIKAVATQRRQQLVGAGAT